MDAVDVVEDEVRELVRRRGLDPAADGAGVRLLVEEVVSDYDERTLSSSLPPLLDRREAVRRSSMPSPDSALCSATSTIQSSKRSGSTNPAVCSSRSAAAVS